MTDGVRTGNKNGRSLPLAGRALAQHIETRKPSQAPKVTLYRVGRVVAATFIPFTAILLWGLGVASAHSYWPGLTILAALLFLPLLLFSVIQCVRLGLHGTAEFFCGIGHLPMSLLGAEMRRRNYNLVGLIYSGLGRLDEADKCFKLSRVNYNIFDELAPPSYCFHNRVPEVLARQGKFKEALVVAEADLVRARSDAADIPCPIVVSNLQSALLVCAHILCSCGRSDSALPYLEEACALGSTAEKSCNEKLLSLYARGLLCFYKDQFQPAADSLEQCKETIYEMRKTSARKKTENSEVLGYLCGVLGQCYIKTGQSAILEDLVKILKEENQSELPASLDKIILDQTEADLKMSQGKTTEALAVLEKSVAALLKSHQPYDGLLVQVLSQYEAILKAAGRDQDAQAIAGSLTKLQAKIPAEDQPLLLADSIKALPPDLTDSKMRANHALGLFVCMVAFTAYKAITDQSNFPFQSWAIFMVIFAFFLGRIVYDHVQNRKYSFLASQAVMRGEAEDIVLKPIGSKLPGCSLLNCRIVSGPQNLIGRELHMSVNANLIYASQACQKADGSEIKARLYQDPTNGEILAIETLGRILTVDRKQQKDSLIMVPQKK